MSTTLTDDHRPTTYAAPDAPAPAPAPAAASDELSDDDLEQVVGGLARTWTDALRAARPAA